MDKTNSPLYALVLATLPPTPQTPEEWRQWGVETTEDCPVGYEPHPRGSLPEDCVECADHRERKATP